MTDKMGLGDYFNFNLGLDRVYFLLGRNIRPERTDLRPEEADFRFKKADFMPEERISVLNGLVSCLRGLIRVLGLREQTDRWTYRCIQGIPRQKKQKKTT